MLGTVFGAGDSLLSGITDIITRVVDGEVQVFTTTRGGGGMLSFDLTTAGRGLVLVDQQALAAGGVLPAPADLDLITVDGQQMLLRSGSWAGSPGGYGLTDAGQFGAAQALEGGPVGQITAQAVAEVDGTAFVAFGLPGGGIELWRLDGAGHLSRGDTVDLGDGTQAVDISALQAVAIGGTSYLLGLSTASDALACHQIGADGTLTPTARVGAAQGLGIADPSALEIAQAGGKTWVFVAGAGSSSISVLALAADGSMALTDHVIDTLDTRFQGVTAMATAVVGDRVFLFAGGGDEGLQAFTLLPDGRLVTVGQQLLTDGLTLDNITALQAVVVDGKIELILGCEGAGVIRLRYDPGDVQRSLRGSGADEALAGNTGADLIWGGGGDDTLSGGGGADVIFDGSGADTLTGGAGADIFVLAADAETEVIEDFEFGVDRLDLSGWGRLYSVEVLPMAERKGCVVIRWGQEAVYLYTADGGQLDPDLFASSDFFALWHVVAPSVPVGGQYSGSGAAETLTGGAGDDTLVGSPGGDLLQGGDGADLVDYGGATAGVVADLADPGGNAGLAQGDRYDAVEGLSGSAYGDTLRGGAGGNLLQGQAGNDLLEGRAGDDRLEGGAGDDRLRPGLGRDTLIGGSGTDTAVYRGLSQAVTVDLAVQANNARGALGHQFDSIENVAGTGFGDRITGNAGANRIDGLQGSDVLSGWSGDDVLKGGKGNDTLTGGSGDDGLNGGKGRDWADYSASGAVRVSLAITAAQDTGAQGFDRLVAIENLRGGAGDDRLTGNARANTLIGGSGDDRIDGGAGKDRIAGQAGNDTLAGGDGFDTLSFAGRAAVRVDLAQTGAQDTGQGRDVISGFEAVEGGQGADLLAGNGAANRLAGGGGHDTLRGETGDDTLQGGKGNDLLVARGGGDVLDGGAGFDMAVYGGGRPVTLSLSITGAQQSGDGLVTLKGIEGLQGGAGADRLTGNGAANRLIGGGGADVLRGAAGADVLLGGDGADTLYGGGGADRITGGAGDDRLFGETGADDFVFAQGGCDRVMDFNAAEGDYLVLAEGFADRAAGMTAAQIVARWGVDLGDSVALQFSAQDRIELAGLATLAALQAVIEVW